MHQTPSTSCASVKMHAEVYVMRLGACLFPLIAGIETKISENPTQTPSIILDSLTIKEMERIANELRVVFPVTRGERGVFPTTSQFLPDTPPLASRRDRVRPRRHRLHSHHRSPSARPMLPATAPRSLSPSPVHLPGGEPDLFCRSRLDP